MRQRGTGWGESGYSLYERTTIRPALTINGMTGGYQGKGVKAVIPAHASAKLNFRLAPGSGSAGDRSTVSRVCRCGSAPPTVRIAIRTDLAAKPAVVDRRHPAVRAAAKAYRRGFGIRPSFCARRQHSDRQSVPGQPGIPTVLMGFALPDDRLHAPNEKLHLPTFFNGIATSIHFLRRSPGSPSPQHGSQRPSRRQTHGDEMAAHDHRLPLPCRKRRWADRSLGHRGAA